MTNAVTEIALYSKPVERSNPVYHLWLHRSGLDREIPAREAEDWGQFVVASNTNKAFVLVRDLVGQHPVAWKLSRIVELTLPSKGHDIDSVKTRLVLTNDLPASGGRSWVHEITEVSDDGEILTVIRAYPIPQDIGTKYGYEKVRLRTASGTFIADAGADHDRPPANRDSPRK